MVNVYIGGGVYVRMEGLDVILTTRNETGFGTVGTTNRIVLGPDVLDELNRYLDLIQLGHTSASQSPDRPQQ